MNRKSVAYAMKACLMAKAKLSISVVTTNLVKISIMATMKHASPHGLRAMVEKRRVPRAGPQSVQIILLKDLVFMIP